MEGTTLRDIAEGQMRLLDLNAHLTGKPFEEIVSDPIRGILQLSFVLLIALHVHRRTKVD